MSRSAIGANELLKLNFVSKEGLCLPVLATKVLEVANIKQVRHSIYDGSWPENRRLTFAAHKYEPDSTEAEVLKCIGGLSNHIIAVSNSKTLQK